MFNPSRDPHINWISVSDNGSMQSILVSMQSVFVLIKVSAIKNKYKLPSFEADKQQKLATYMLVYSW